MTSEGIFSQEEVDLIIKLESIFMPEARKLRDAHFKREIETGAVEQSAKFVHYTSAEAALKIIKNKCLWMRNSLCMSDYREVQHGYNILQRFLAISLRKTHMLPLLKHASPARPQTQFLYLM